MDALEYSKIYKDISSPFKFYDIPGLNEDFTNKFFDNKNGICEKHEENLLKIHQEQEISQAEYLSHLIKENNICTIKYIIKGNEQNIKLFGEKFVNNNKKNCRLIL